MAHSEVKELKAERTKEVGAVECIVDSVQGMDKSVESLVRGINVLQMGCEYRNGEDPRQHLYNALKRNLVNYEAQRNAAYQTLEGRAHDLQAVLGKTQDTQLKDMFADIKEKGKQYADKIF